MVWLFERGEEKAMLEVRRYESQFQLALRHADGKEQIEILATPRALFARLERVPDLFLADGWRPVSTAPDVC